MPQIGATFYIAWGLLHLYAAFQVSKLGKRQKAGMVQGRIYQSVWNLAALAVAVIAVAAVYNWFNNPAGYWLNLALTSVTEAPAATRGISFELCTAAEPNAASR